MALDLGKQVGPLPLGAWVVVVGGGLGIAWYTKRNSNSTEVVEDGSGQPGVGDGSVGGWVPNFPSQGSNPGESSNPRDAVKDNDTWYTYIFQELVARNYDSTLVDSALRKYLAGLSSKLSVGEWTIIRIALSIMPPPNPIPASPDDPNPPTVPVPKPPVSTPGPTKPAPKPPAPKPAPPKPSIRYYTVVKGDNLWNISKRFYKSGIYWGRIYSANRYGVKRADGTKGMIKNSNLIQPGWKLIIP